MQKDGGSVGATGQVQSSAEEASNLMENTSWPKPPEVFILIGEAEEIMNKTSMCSTPPAAARPN